MVKYNIEGNIDFYAELYNSLDIEDDEKVEDKNICLITNKPLTDKYIIMNCGHKFNYIPLYKDIVNHKNKFNSMESSSGKLTINEIRCPYCRKKQKYILPYYEELGLPKVNGVNWYEHNAPARKIIKCMYKFPNENYDPTQPETELNLKYKKTECGIGYAAPIQLHNSANELHPITFGDNNCYCYYHKQLMIKQYKAEEKQKVKEQAKLAKMNAKLEAKKAKDLEKQKIKEEKQKAKEALKKISKSKNKNEVIGHIVLEVETQQEYETQSEVETQSEGEKKGCIAIIKSGVNKGKPCGCQTKMNMLCGRHYKLSNNINIIND